MLRLMAFFIKNALCHSCFLFLYPVLLMALKDVNTNDSVLANYELEPVIVDGQCKADMVMKGFIDIITNDDYKKSFIGILGKFQ